MFALQIMANQWTQIESLFHAAVKLSAAERSDFLTEACAGNDELRLEVEALLAADNSSESVTAILSPQVIADGLAYVQAERFTGKLINHYQVISPLGAGGMGEVFLAEDARLQRKVALKLLPDNYTNDRERVRRFEQEARAASALNHPNIITIHDLGESDSGCFIVMEHVAGRTLRALATENIELLSLLDWGSQTAKALSAAHAANIIHRDIKPDNIMVRDDGYVKVLDFGLARLNTAHDELSNAMTMPGTVMGTVKYMSPEQTRGEIVTTASDIFAFGIVLYELATGRHPFNGASLLAVMQAITSQTPVTPAQLNPTLPAELNTLLLRMLAKDATARPSAIEVVAALTEIERGNNHSPLSTSHSALRTLPLRHTVGREAERAELRAAFRSGRGSLLCVAGEPGIGKTTLVEDFLTELAAGNQCTIARGRCSERLAGTEAYLPLLEAVESLFVRSPAFRRNGLGEYDIPPESGTTNSLMRQLAPTWYAQVASLSSDDKLLAEVKAASQERMKRELAAFLQAVAQSQPLVIFFDDLHWADVSTIDLLNFLAGKFDTMRVLMIVTYRPSDMLLAKHPFLQIKPDLQARGVCRELLLEFLTEKEIAEYLALEFPGHNFPSEFPALIHAKTEGSPLFMADLVRYLRDRSVIANTSGAWTLAQTLPDIERELPESVRGMIERKISQLEPDDHKLLTAASVQGYEFDSAVVAQMLNLDADEIEERLETLERVFAFVKLVNEAEFPNGTLTLKYRFVHVLYQNALYAGLRVTRKATLSRDVALALEACYGARSASVANELALLWEAARDYGRAADSFLQAAKHSSRVFAVQEAEQLARRGLAMIEKLPDDAARQTKELPLQILLANALIATQGYSASEVEQAYLRGHELCQSLGDAADPLPILGGLGLFRSMRGQFQAGREMAEEFLEIARRKHDPAELFGQQMIAFSVYYPGDLLGAIKLYQECAAAYEPALHRSLAWVYGDDLGSSTQAYLSLLQWQAGYPQQAFHHLEESLRLAQEVPQANSRAFSLYFKAYQYLLRREPDEALRGADQTIALCVEHGLPFWIASAKLVRGWALAQQGQPDEGIDELCEGAAIYQGVGTEVAQTILFCMMADAYLKAQKSAEGLQAVEQGLAIVEKNNERVFAAELWRLKGELQLQSDVDHHEAERCFQQAIEIAQQQSAKSWELRAATSLARLWQQQGKTAEARQMLAEIYGWFTEGFDTADLQDAKALLEELRSEFNLQVVRSASEDTLKRELSTSTPSIAVLPFVNISNDPDNEYFCDGLAEELLNALSKIEALHVAARTSSFSFKGKETDIREIGQKLNVGAVLEGSVRKSGNRLRITAQLINIADGYHLWSERYDRQMEDIFDIQDEISLAIVDALKVKLLGAEKAAVTKRYTDNTEAYELYLKGRFHYGKWTEEGLKKSIEFFNQAISQEPNFAPAYAGVVNAYVYLWFYGFTSPDESIPIIKSAAAKAVAIDSELAESQFALTRMKVFYEWDWSGADRGFKRTLALNPNYAEAYEQYSSLLALMGRTDEAIAMGRRALELDPVSLNANLNVGFTFWTVGRYDLFREQSEKLIEIAPDFFGGYYQIAAECWGTGKYEQAIAAFTTAVACGAFPALSAYLGYLYGLTGKRDEAQKILHQLQELSEQRHLLPFELGIVKVGLGELDYAFALFEQAYEQRAGILIYFKYIAAMMPGFKDDPRLADLLRRIGLPE